MAYTTDEKTSIETISLISASMSFLGAGFIMLMFICYPSLRSFAYRLIFYLAISDFGSAIFVLINPLVSNEEICKFQGVGSSLFNLASVLWVTTIACSLYGSIVVQH